MLSYHNVDSKFKLFKTLFHPLLVLIGMGWGDSLDPLFI